MNNSCKLLFIIWMTPFCCYACPNCIGTIDEDSAPFFSDDCYKDPQQLTPQPIQDQKQGDHHE